MNIFIIIGILIIAFGTGTMAYGFSIVAGILLTAFGTGTMIYGQLVKNKADSAEVSQVLQDKVDSVLKRIEEVREGEKEEVSSGKIHQIEEEFKNWAAEFLKDRERKKLELAKSGLDLVDTQLNISNEWRPIFQYVLTTIESLASAYNMQSGETIEVDFPPIPPNLYSEEASNYNGKVIFHNNFYWHISLRSSKPAKKNNPPRMDISFHMGKEHYLRDSWLMIGDYDAKSFMITINGSNIPVTNGIEGTYPFDSYRDSLKRIICRLFEAQLLQD